MLERRVLLTAMAATLAMPAFAQTTRNESAKDSSKEPSADAGVGTGKLGAAEQKHMMDSMAIGSMSLVASRAAVKKVRDEDVKEFAEFEVAEQELLSDVLTSMKDPSKATGQLKPPSE